MKDTSWRCRLSPLGPICHCSFWGAPVFPYAETRYLTRNIGFTKVMVGYLFCFSPYLFSQEFFQCKQIGPKHLLFCISWFDIDPTINHCLTRSLNSMDLQTIKLWGCKIKREGYVIEVRVVSLSILNQSHYFVNGMCMKLDHTGNTLFFFFFS